MERIYDTDLRNVDEVESLYPPLEVTPNNASNLSDFLVVKHRGTFKRATLEEPWQPGSESIQVTFLSSFLLHFNRDLISYFNFSNWQESFFSSTLLMLVGKFLRSKM